MKKNGLTREESIRLEAYLLSEKAGHPTGMEQFFWMQAEALVQKRSTTTVPTRKTTRTAPVTAAAAKPARAKKSAPVIAKPMPVKKATEAATAKKSATSLELPLQPAAAPKRPAAKKKAPTQPAVAN